MTSFPTDGSADAAPRAPGEYDALADLFLGGTEAKPAPRAPSLRLVADEPVESRSTTRERSPSTAHIEAMLLGSLPVYASAWIMQFVRAETERLGTPVVLVRSLAGEGSVDVVGEAARSLGLPRVDSMSEAISLAAQRCGRVIVRTGETSEADLAAHDAVRSVTLLTGVDEPALIAAYRTLKALAPRWSVMPTPPAVRIAAMGASDEQGRRAFEKIARAAKVFLETPLAYAGNVERIEPATSVCVFRGPTGADIEEVLRDARSTAPQGDSADEAPIVEIRCEEPMSTERSLTEPETPVGISVASETHDSLASRLAGLVRIPIEIPRCDGVELAADASGRLHMLAADDSSMNPTSTLLSAQAWALLNRDLLAAACSTMLGRAVESGTRATLHLFTDQPKRVRGLLDADIRVHFLASVEMNGERAWCVAELN